MFKTLYLYFSNTPRVCVCVCVCAYRGWGSVVIKVLRYKSVGPGIDSRFRRKFSLASKNKYQVNPASKGGRCVRLTTYHLHVPMSRNLGALTSWNPVGIFRHVMGLI
jgi:hypothetical protein